VTFGSAPLEPGLYDVVLLSDNTEEVSLNSFWVVDANAVPNLSTDKNSYYEVRLMLDDGYQVLGSSRFTVEP
jgi:hypothetical protein